MRRLVILAALSLGAVSITGTGGPAPVRAQTRSSYPADLVWLGLGDSYSSGEGLRFVDAQANPPGHDCQRATGTTTVNGEQGSRAWAKVAYDTVRGQMTNSTFQLLACTGAVTNEIHNQYRTEWGSAHPGVKADLITLSMGGNNLGFADILKRCIGVSPVVEVIELNPAIGCDITEATLRVMIGQLVGTSHVGPDGGQTLRDMYIELATNAVSRGGNIIVAGYPNIVEESGRWVLGLLEGNRCHRIRRADATMLRSVTGYLNQQIALLVKEMNHQIRDVGFTWVDVSKVYEADNGSRHGLCTGDPWINGVSLGTFGPHDDRNPFRFDRSFHPTQDGHDHTGAKIAEVVGTLDWSHLDRTPDPVPLTRDMLLNVAVPSLCGHLAGRLVNGDLPREFLTGEVDPGYMTLGDKWAVGDVDGDGHQEIAAQFQCSQGGVSWPDVVVIFRDDLSVVGSFSLGDVYPDAWRGGFNTITATADGFAATAGIERTGISANTYIIESFTFDIVDGQVSYIPLQQAPSGGGECPDVANVDENQNTATQVTATGMSCTEAADLVQAVITAEEGVGHTTDVAANGFECTIEQIPDEASILEKYACTADARRLTWQVYYGE
jgi:GDSL-like Lipase/Acylhydrolase family